MVFQEDGRTAPVGCTVTRRVTILPSAEDPGALDFLTDLVVTRGGARFTLPEHESRRPELRQYLPLAWTYSYAFRETLEEQRLELEYDLISLLEKAWKSAFEFDPDEATVFISS